MADTATAAGTRQQVLDSLNADLAKEHGAIVQYLLHIAHVRDSGLRWSISNATREEMWHMEWLIEAIRDRGGTPTLDREEEIVNTNGIIENIEADIHAEEDALAHYEQTLAVVGDSDDELRTLIERIMDDERHHRTSFTRNADRVGSQGEDAFRAKPLLSPADAGSTVPMVGLEYEGLLQYLWNKYAVGAGEESETYFELAINEMRHLGWVASCFGGLPAGPPPPVPAEKIVDPAGSEQAHSRAEEYERKAQGVIADVRGKLAGQDIAEELSRIDFQHGYHRFQLEHWESDEEG
jgi:rubrerythrin